MSTLLHDYFKHIRLLLTEPCSFCEQYVAVVYDVGNIAGTSVPLTLGYKGALVLIPSDTLVLGDLKSSLNPTRGNPSCRRTDRLLWSSKIIL